jgi:hypothetical protein
MVRLRQGHPAGVVGDLAIDPAGMILAEERGRLCCTGAGAQPL